MYVFDTTPLTHFARAGLLTELSAICEGVPCVLAQEVEDELKKGRNQYPENEAILKAKWLEARALTDHELPLFAWYAGRIGISRDRNTGECETLALAQSNGATAIVDDMSARNAAKFQGVDIHGTAWLIIRGVKRQVWSEKGGNAVANQLLDTGIRFPFKRDEFIGWARQNWVLEDWET